MSNLTLQDADRYDWDGRRQRIVELAGQGHSQIYISKAVGLDVKTVGRILKSEFSERNANKQLIVQAHAQTVQWMKLKITSRITESGNNWDRRDMETLLKVLDREAKVFGIDQPTQHDVNVTVEQLSDDDLVKQLAAEGIVVQLPTPPPLKALPEAVIDAEFVSHDDRQPDGTVSPQSGADLSGA